MQDSSGPFDCHLTRRLLALCERLCIDHERDVFDHYRSDAAAALEAGAATRAALIGVGVDATHGHERTHGDGIVALCRLLLGYCGGLSRSATGISNRSARWRTSRRRRSSLHRTSRNCRAD